MSHGHPGVSAWGSVLLPRLPPDRPNEEAWGQQRKRINLLRASGPLGPTAQSKPDAPGRGWVTLSSEGREVCEHHS